MNSRLGKVLLRNLVPAAFLYAFGLLLDGTPDAYFALLIPLVYVVGVTADYFIWTNPRFAPPKPERRPNIRL